VTALSFIDENVFATGDEDGVVNGKKNNTLVTRFINILFN